MPFHIKIISYILLRNSAKVCILSDTNETENTKLIQLEIKFGV